MKTIYKYVIAVDGKFHSIFDAESDAQAAILNVQGNTSLTVVYTDGVGKRIDKKSDQIFKIKPLNGK